MKYIKRRVEIEAIEFTGGNYRSVDVFVGKTPGQTPLGGPYKVETSSGVRRAYPGDMVIKIAKDDFIVMDQVDFEEEFEQVEENSTVEDKNE